MVLFAPDRIAATSLSRSGPGKANSATAKGEERDMALTMPNVSRVLDGGPSSPGAAPKSQDSTNQAPAKGSGCGHSSLRVHHALAFSDYSPAWAGRAGGICPRKRPLTDLLAHNPG